MVNKVNCFVNLKRGFTLAECLITVAIVGVVAALLLSNYIRNTQIKTLKTQLSTTYAELNQISRRFMLDHDESVASFAVSANQLDNTKLYNEIGKYFNGRPVKIAKNYQWVNNNTNNAGLPYEIKSLRGENKKFFSGCDVPGGLKMSLSGKIYALDDKPSRGINGPLLCIDINGYKKPNTMGMDIFVFVFTIEGDVLPFGDPKANPFWFNGSKTISNPSSSCLEQLTKTRAQQDLSCTYNALHNINPKGSGTYWEDFIAKKQYKD